MVTRTARQAHPSIFFPVEEDVGESIIQTLILEVLRPLVLRFLLSRGIKAFVGADQFIYWDGTGHAVTLHQMWWALPTVEIGLAVRFPS